MKNIFEIHELGITLIQEAELFEIGKAKINLGAMKFYVNDKQVLYCNFEQTTGKIEIILNRKG